MWRRTSAKGEKRSQTVKSLRHRVLLIHGINTNADWYTPARAVLRTFFYVVPHEFATFRERGETRLVFDPPWIAPVVGATLAGAILAIAPLWGATIALVGVGHFRARLGLRREVNRLIDQLPETEEADLHVVAHSLGTFLFGQALRRQAFVRVRYVAFVASVLRRHYKWGHRLLQRQFERLRNDCGILDPVPVAASMLALLHLPFGLSGRLGFRGPASLVHNVAFPALPCGSCTGADVAPLHNVFHEDAAHSDLLSGLFAQRVWLPFLLGYDAGEWQATVDLCRDIRKAVREDSDGKGKLIDDLFDNPWTWLKGTTLRKFLSQLVARKLAGTTDEKMFVDHYAKDALFRFCAYVAALERDMRSKMPSRRLEHGVDLLRVARNAAHTAVR